MMTLKKRLLEDKYKFIPNFDFTVELSMRDECMLNYLIDVANYFDISLEDDTPFEITPEYIRKRKPAWGIRQIRDSLASLCDLGFIEKVGNKGRGNLYRLCNDKILSVCLASEKYSNEDNESEECVECTSSINKMLNETIQNDEAASTKCKTNNNIDNNKNKNNKNKYSESKKNSLSNKHQDEILEIITYLNKKLGTRYRPNARAASQHIPARLEEGFTVEDFKIIIDKKFDDWHNTEFEKYLRPGTLFAPSHFEDYLNQRSKKPSSKKLTRGNIKEEVLADEVF